MFGLFNKNKTTEVDNSPKSAKNIRIPSTVQDSIPFKRIFVNGMIKDYNSRYSKTYAIGSANFDTLEDSSQEKMYLDWEKVINIIDDTSVGQLTVINRDIDMDIVRNEIMLKPKNDRDIPMELRQSFNVLRGEINDKYTEDLKQGRNNIKKDVYLTISVPAKNRVEAASTLARIDNQVSKTLRKVTGEPTKALNAKDRLELFYNIYNAGELLPYSKKIAPFIKDGNIDPDLLKKYNVSPKDIIGPDSMKMDLTGLKFGSNIFVKTYYIDALPTELSTNFLNDITDIPCNMITSISWTQMDVGEANNMVKQRLLDMNSAISNQQSAAAKDGVVDGGAISPELQDMRDEAQSLMDDIRKNNMKCFFVTPLITLIAMSKEELLSFEKTLKASLTKFSCHLRTMENQMENSFNTTLPLAQLNIANDRFMQTEAASVFFPFSVQDLNQPNGVDYGVNPLSHNIVRINRWDGRNYNGLFIGESGSGKSFAAKNEILQRLLGTNDQILIIDPEGEYAPMGEYTGAEVIKISYNTNMFINPMDLDVSSGDGGNPIPAKCDELITLINTMMGGDDYEFTAAVKNTIIRAVNETYREYYNHMLKIQKEASERGEEAITCDRSAMPTLANLYSTLIKFQEPEAQFVASSIENYCVGDGAIFAHRTNINPHNQMIIFDVSAMTDNMKDVAMQVAMSYCWNRIIENGNNGRNTDLYIDEFHLFTKNRISAAYMKNIYKRARKWRGSPTAITQNVNDMFVNDEATAIFNNCSFICMLSQSSMDRNQLSKTLSLSEAQLDFITDQPSGCGLIYNGSTVVPFENEANPHTEMFKLTDSIKKDKKQKAS